MGNDGGSIPKRRELVKEAAKAPSAAQLKESQQEQLAYRWTTDPLTGRPLRPPVVSDCAGRLYNKDAILEFLLPADVDGDDTVAAAARKADAARLLAGSVASLRDVVEVHFASDSDGGSGSGAAWVCPVSNKPLGAAGAPAVYLVPCGHAFAAAVVREVDERACALCGAACAPDDVIPILSLAQADVDRLAARIRDLKARGLTHSLKKMPGSKKRKKNAEASAAAEATANGGEPGREKGVAKGANGTNGTNGTNGSRDKLEAGIKNASTASLTAKVLEEQEARNKKRKLQRNENLESLFSSRDQTKPLGKGNDFMSRGFTIPGHEKS